MGSSPHSRRRSTALGLTLAATVLVLGACASDDDSGDSAATGETMEASAGTVGGGRSDGDSSFATPGTTTSARGGSAEEPDAGSDVDVVAADDGAALAIEAQTTLTVEDVRVAVDSITRAVNRHGGRVAMADIDYGPQDDRPRASRERERATIVAEVPPDELDAVLDELEGLGTVTSFDQFAEDVGERLADLDIGIANERASISRVRELVASAEDLEDLVFLESELTSRETRLEEMLASQRNLEDRVAMSTLTVGVTEAPVRVITPIRGEVEARRPGVVEALADGWSVFIGALFSVVIVLAVSAPFVFTAIVLGAVALWVRRKLLGRPPRPAPPVVFEARGEPVGATSDPQD